jgi:pimeloyl-ACP methyl ester carboxylesterase
MNDVLLLHSGIGDGRQWAPQLESWSGRFRLHAPDLPGFGGKPLEPREYAFADEAVAVLDEGGVERAAVVGSSFGGRIALETALLHPERVVVLVLVAAALPDSEPSERLRAAGEQEDELVGRGQLEAAARLMVETWVPDAPAAVRRYVHDAQLAAYRLQEGVEASLRPLEPPLPDRLAEIDVPALVLYGERDLPDFRSIAERLAAELPRAEGPVAVPGANHLPNLERPDAFDALVLPFLERVL